MEICIGVAAQTRHSKFALLRLAKGVFGTARTT